MELFKEKLILKFMLLVLILLTYPVTNVIAQCHSECVGVEPDYRTKIFIKLPFQNEPTHLTVDVKDNLAYIDGDIILGDINELQQQKDDILNGVAIDGNDYRWENAVIPYEIGNFSITEIQKINDAAKYISENTNLCVIPRTNEVDYVFVKSVNEGCSSFVGKIGGKQTINLSKNCSYGTVIHEFLHAAGLYHEQSRSDRDNYISINFNNILEGKEHNFNKRVENASDYGSYDYASIMHYNAFAFAKNSLIPTITTIPAGIQIGQREALSWGDISTINSIYPNACNKDLTDLAISNCGFGSISTQRISLTGIAVKNIGNAISETTKLATYFSTDTQLSDDDYLISTSHLSPLLPGNLTSFTIHKDISKINPPLPEGIYHIILGVDVQNEIDELDETNNSCSTNTFTVSYGCNDRTAHNFSNSYTYVDNSICETCVDGIKNGDEQGVDCGRVCGNTCELCASDRAALITLYNTTDGANWKNKWDLTKPMDTWHGVQLNDDGCVILLNLFSNRLKGTIPPEIGNLSELTYLRLSNNDLSGSIPTSIGNLSKLRSLYLNNNNLSRLIPDEIGNCKEIKFLSLNDNQLTGSIPFSFSTLKNLNELSTQNNQLSGCFDRSLSILCEQLTDFYNSNERISDGNNFEIPWEDFCRAGYCAITTSSSGYLNFDGFDDYVEVPKSPIEQITGDFTFEAWIQGEESKQTQHPIIFSNRNNAAGGGFKFFFHGLWRDSKYKMLSLQLNSNNYKIINNGTYNGSLLDGTCHHVAVSLKNYTLSFYVDGELFGTSPIAAETPVLDIDEPIWIGSEQATSNRFEGSIWDVRIWNKARTATEIKSTFDQDVDSKTPYLLSYWKLNEGEGQTIFDKTSLANGYLGNSIRSDKNDPLWIDDIGCSTSKSYGYLNFDGVNDYVEVPNTPIKQIDGDFTFEAWVQGEESKQTYHPIIFSNRNNAAGGGFKFFFHGLWGGSKYKMLCIQLNSKNYPIINNGTFDGNILDNNCHHVAVSKQDDELSYYVDGEFFGSRSIYTSEPVLDINEPIWIGSEQATSNSFEGLIWDVRIWNKARTATEIKNAMNQDVSAGTPNLLSYWKLNEGEAQTITDKTGLANGYLGSSERDDQYDPLWVNDIDCSVESRNDDIVSTIQWNTSIITLEQNSPNPANEFTHIKYYVPNSIQKATLNIYSLAGKLVQSVDLQREGKSIIKLDVSSWNKGMYIYSIQSDADVIATKKMLVH